MSRRIVIEGSVTVEVSELAEEVVAEMRREGAAIRYDAQQKCFAYEGYDDHYRDEVAQAQKRYGAKLQDLRVRQVIENAEKRGYKVEQVKVGDKIKVKAKLRVYA